jgi:amino acid transporter
MSTKISVSTATIIGMNAMIGAGIFSITSLLASTVGPAGILTYLFAFTAVWFMAKSIARTAYLFPEEGGFYVYAKQFGGHHFGLLAAAGYLFGLLTAAGLLCGFAGDYLHEVIPGLSSSTLGLTTFFALVVLNLLGAKLSEIGQYVLIILTVFPLITSTIMCLTKIDLTNLTPFMPYGLPSVLEGTSVAIFGLFGFECTTSLFNIVQDPEKNVPRALTYSLLIVGIIYLFFIGSIILSIPLSVFTANPSITIPQALAILFPGNPVIILCITVSILSAIIGTIHSMIWGGSELILSFIKHIKIAGAQTAIKTGSITQRHCVLLCGAIILTAYLGISNKNIFFCLTNIGLIFAYITALLPLLFIKSEWRSGQNITTILGLITACTIFVIAVMNLVENIA